MMQGLELRQAVLNEEIDYNQLKSLLNYADPRSKIKRWLKEGTLIRVKKGLYVFGPRCARVPYSKETLANLIYGPSAISLEYALSFYRLIPERVDIITSITPLRDKTFATPVGYFTYRYLALAKYAVGLNRIKLDDTHYIFIATPEKALMDVLLLTRPMLMFADIIELESFLLNDLRIPEESLFKLNKKILKEIKLQYNKKSCDLLYQLILKSM